MSSPSPVRTFWDIPYQKGINNSKNKLNKILDTYSKSSESEIKHFQSNFFDPLTITIDGKTKPGFYVDHHISHAYYAGFYSQEDSLVATLDGGTSIAPFISGGIYWFTKKNGIFPLASHNLALGAIYDRVAMTFDLDSGKLMGLSSYAYPHRSINDILLNYVNKYQIGEIINENIIAEHIKASSVQGSNQLIDKINSKKFKFNVGNTDFAIQSAANTQYFVQEAYIYLIGKYCAQICNQMLSLNTVYTTGGFSLNCPTNTKINHIYPKTNFIPLPGVGDTGLSIGAAVALTYFFESEIKLKRHNPAFPPSSYNFNIKKGNFKKLKKITINKNQIIDFLTKKLLEGKIICRHAQRSEVGPRALGRRSILAWAGTEMIRDVINKKKGRENWRPLAPICKLEDFSNFFIGDSYGCEYMLTISKVKSKDIPAVTHVDNTARVQVIDINKEHKNEELCSLLKSIKQKNFAPILINTSFNCANEPIVETLEDAAKSFLKMGLDYLWTDEGLYEALT